MQGRLVHRSVDIDNNCQQYRCRDLFCSTLRSWLHLVQLFNMQEQVPIEVHDNLLHHHYVRLGNTMLILGNILLRITEKSLYPSGSRILYSVDCHGRSGSQLKLKQTLLWSVGGQVLDDLVVLEINEQEVYLSCVAGSLDHSCIPLHFFDHILKVWMVYSRRDCDV